MKNVHWTTLNDVEGTVWGSVGGFGEDDFGEVFSDLKDEFSLKKKNSAVGKDGEKKKQDGKEKKKKIVTLITDGKRSQNINIMLGKLTHHGKRKMEDIASMVLRLEASAIGIDGLEALLLNTPNKKEIASVVAFEGDQQRLGKPEKYVLALSAVPHLMARIQAMLFKLNVDEIYHSVSKDTKKVMAACRDLKGSVKFVRLLGIVLEVGNSLNKGTNKIIMIGLMA